MILSARPLSAETVPAGLQQQVAKQTPAKTDVPIDSNDPSPSQPQATAANEEEEFVVAAAPYLATAYSLRGRTASGKPVAKGVIAADPRFLPLGSRVRLEAGPYSGEYLVADTGGSVRGRHIDIWTPTAREAMRFGKRTIKLTVLSFGGRRGTPRRGTSR